MPRVLRNICDAAQERVLDSALPIVQDEYVAAALGSCIFPRMTDFLPYIRMSVSWVEQLRRLNLLQSCSGCGNVG